MTLQLDLVYTDLDWETKLGWKIEEINISSWDIPFSPEVIIVVTDTKEWTIMAMNWPQMSVSSDLLHTVDRWFEKIKKAEKVNVWVLRYNNYTLLILLHKAVIQSNIWTSYILQILKYMSHQGSWELEWKCKWFFSSFTSIDLMNSNWVLKVDEESLQWFLNWDEKDRFSWSSEAKIIRI